jgi:benzoyl-CoA reductase/2-hydroxyglutaryl-CoA dehydratase subunit BcrC/BadD/HgdB
MILKAAVAYVLEELAKAQAPTPDAAGLVLVELQQSYATDPEFKADIDRGAAMAARLALECVADGSIPSGTVPS